MLGLQQESMVLRERLSGSTIRLAKKSNSFVTVLNLPEKGLAVPQRRVQGNGRAGHRGGAMRYHRNGGPQSP